MQSCFQEIVDSSELWRFFREEAERLSVEESTMKTMLKDAILDRRDFTESMASRLSRKLERADMSREELLPLLDSVMREHPIIVSQMVSDLWAINERDPACQSPLQPFLYYKGFMAVSTYRIGHQLWKNGRGALALWFQSLGSQVFGVDIHPAARIGCGIMLDHASGVVIGETAIVEDQVSILHAVTLGGTGKQTGDRHPIIRTGVLIGAGAKILGRVEIGAYAKVGAGSVVLDHVPPHTTVAGVPATIVGKSVENNPASSMDQSLNCTQL